MLSCEPDESDCEEDSFFPGDSPFPEKSLRCELSLPGFEDEVEGLETSLAEPESDGGGFSPVASEGLLDAARPPASSVRLAC